MSSSVSGLGTSRAAGALAALPARPSLRTRFSFKASHRRMSLKISHGGTAEEAPPVRKDGARERYLAPPKRR